MVGVLPATKCPKGQVKERFSSSYVMLGLWISPAGAEKGRPLLATVKTLKGGQLESKALRNACQHYG